MPQELQVLRCYACKKFQVQIVKKAPKWQCKVCNEKQSVLKVYAQGSGKDCRQYVQDLNMKQGLLMESAEDLNEPIDEPKIRPAIVPPVSEVNRSKGKASKWADYLEDDSSLNAWEQSEVPEQDEGNEEITINPRARKEKRRWNESNAFDTNEFESCDGFQEGGKELSDYSEDYLFSYDPEKFDPQRNSGSQKARKTSSALVMSGAALRGNQSKWHNFVSQTEVSSISSAKQGQCTFNEVPILQDSNDCQNPVNSHMDDRKSRERGNTSKWSQFISQSESSDSLRLSEENCNIAEKNYRGNNDTKVFWESHSPKVNPPKAQKMTEMSNIKKPYGPNSLNANMKSISVVKVSDSSIYSEKSNPQSDIFRNPFCTTDDENLDSLLDF